MAGQRALCRRANSGVVSNWAADERREADSLEYPIVGETCEFKGAQHGKASRRLWWRSFFESRQLVLLWFRVGHGFGRLEPTAANGLILVPSSTLFGRRGQELVAGVAVEPGGHPAPFRQWFRDSVWGLIGAKCLSRCAVAKGNIYSVDA